MKNVICITSILFFFSSLFGQAIQEGMVRELNSNRNPIPNVIINFETAHSTISDDYGFFRLVFQDKKAGDPIILKEIRKKGYELVNKEDFEVTRISNSNKFPFDIILAKLGVIEAARKEYYNISNKALIANYEKEKNNFRAQLKSEQIIKQEYYNKLKELQIQYDIQKRNLDDYANKFARINLDDIEPIHKEALELFKNGKVNKAIEILENANLSERTDSLIKERKRIESAQDNYIAERNSQIEILLFQIKLLKTKFDYKKVEKQYLQLLSLDSNDLNILEEVTNFYLDQRNYKKVRMTSQQIINHPQANIFQIANGFNLLGDFHIGTGNLVDAFKAYDSAFVNQQKLHKQYPNNFLYKKSLAVLYSKLGKTYTLLGNLDSALVFFKEDFSLGKELYNSDQQNTLYKKNLATTIERLGETFSALGNLDSAIVYFEKDEKLRKELLEHNSNIDNKNALAISQHKLGQTHFILGNIVNAKMFSKKATKLFEEVVKVDSLNIHFKNGLAVSYSNLGEIYTILDSLDVALQYYKKDSVLTNELLERSPQDVDLKLKLAISNDKLGEINTFSKKMKLALHNFKYSDSLKKELYELDFLNVDFKYGVAVSQSKLGETYLLMDSIEQSLVFFIEALKLTKELYNSFPKDVYFNYGVAVSYQKLGDVYAELDSLECAYRNYKKSLKFGKQLYDENPKNVDFKNGLAHAYAVLGVFCNEKLKEKKKAKGYFLSAEKLWLELTLEVPEHVQYKNFLTLIRDELNKLEKIKD